MVEEAKRLKHEADQETNMETKCRKYLQVGHESKVRTIKRFIFLIFLKFIVIFSIEDYLTRGTGATGDRVTVYIHWDRINCTDTRGL